MREVAMQSWLRLRIRDCCTSFCCFALPCLGKLQVARGIAAAFRNNGWSLDSRCRLVGCLLLSADLILSAN